MNLLIEVIQNEISKQYLEFQVIVFQLYYDVEYDVYQRVKEEDITSIVCVKLFIIK